MRTAVLAAGVFLSMIGSCFAQTSTAALSRVETRIPPQFLGDALQQVAKLRHIQVLSLTADVKNLRTRGASGKLTEDETLTRLLVGTGLKYVHVDANAVSVIRSYHSGGATRRTSLAADATHADPRANVAKPKSKTPHEIPGTKIGSVAPDPQSTPPTHGHAAKESPLREVVVTGTYIIGITSTPSFTSTYSRNEMYSTGAGSIAQFVQQMPASFADASEVTVAGTQGGPAFTLNNNVAAAGIDIHGLGVQSTLVLVNGFRLAPGNYNGGFVDVSMLPLSAVDHVDIVADSASATYGSDAVGGVANILTLRRFQGAETRVRYGSVTEGARHEIQVSETAGASWSTGSAVLSYEYNGTTPLAASSRSFSHDAQGPFTLLPEETAHKFYGSLTEAPSDTMTLRGFLIYGHRDAQGDFISGGRAVYDRTGTVDSGISEIGLQKQFAWGGVGNVSVEYSANDTDWVDAVASSLNVPNYEVNATVDGRSRLGAADLGFTGECNSLGDRRIKYAVGAQVRREWYSYTDALNQVRFGDSRTVTSEYAELWVPLVRNLDMSLDDREEHYSDFGSTNNAKVGLLWRPSPAVTVRATYSTAFRAPSLYDLLNIDQALYSPIPNTSASGVCAVSGPGCTDALVLYGGNPQLNPEKAKTWTGGIEVHPESLGGFDAGVSFYDIEYYDRINIADSAINVYNSLDADEGALGQTIVREGLPQQEIQQLAALAPQNETFNYGVVSPASITTLIDDRSHNIASLSTRGVDFRIAYALGGEAYVARTELSGTRIIQYANRFTSLTPAVDSIDTAYNPLRVKMRLHENLDVGNFSASVFLNYTGAYINSAVTPAAPVASWATLDVSLSYKMGLSDSDDRLKGYLSIGAFNLMDKAPPYVQNPYYPVNFDGANASPLGRFVYVEISVVL